MRHRQHGGAARGDQSIEKYNVPVRVQFPDGSLRHGLIFLRHGQRIMDLLCEASPFFALRTKKGVSLVGKSNIAALDILEREQFETERDLFPPFDWNPLENRSW